MRMMYLRPIRSTGIFSHSTDNSKLYVPHQLIRCLCPKSTRSGSYRIKQHNMTKYICLFSC